MNKLPYKVFYSDVNLHVGTDSSYDVVYNEESINSSLDAIWGVKIKSKCFRRKFGSRLGHLLFDPINRTSALLIESEMKTLAIKWEPRISDVSMVVLPDFETQTYYVEFNYTIPALSNKKVSYKFNMSKGV